MARNHIIVSGLIALVTFAAGLGIGRVTSQLAEKPNPVVISETNTNVAPEPFSQPREYETLREADAPRASVAEARQPEGFAFAGLTLDTSTQVPRACFAFTQPVDATGNTTYTDYIKVDPASKIVAEPVENSICIEGLAFDADYTATLREGLPAADGSKLAHSEKVTIAFGDKPAYVGFVGNGVILPRMEADGIGFETVNVSKLNVRIHRVGDRALAFKQLTAGNAVAEDRYGYAWDQESGTDVGPLIWDGSIDVNGTINEKEVTVFPLGAALGEARAAASDKGVKAGAYFIEVNDGSDGADKSRPARAWRWVMFTDMALTVFKGGDGMDVIVRSLETARPMNGVTVNLIAQNNDILAKTTSDANGLVRFPGPVTKGEGPLRPRMIMAYGGREDFAAIDLTRAPLDLSDRDISGRGVSGVVDGYVYFDRGIYRPGETAYISGMIRNAAGNALIDRSLTLEILRPNYTKADEIRIQETQIGGFSTPYDLPRSAPRGTWTVRLKADGVDTVHTSTFSVEDFVPQRIAVALDSVSDKPIGSGERRAIDIEARFLYGAPGSALNVEGEARLRVDPAPFAEYKSFQFKGAKRNFTQRSLRLGKTVTDAEGKARLNLGVDRAVKSTGKPLRADIVIGVAEPGGRVVAESLRVPVRVDKGYLGIRTSESQKIGDNAPTAFDLVLVDQTGGPLEGNLEWKIVEEDYRFEWYRQNGEWRWRRDYRDIDVATGTLKVSSEKIATLSRQLGYGAYRLEINDPVTKAVLSHRFYAGWQSYASGAQTPDQVSLTLPEEPVVPGAAVKVTIDAPYAGEALITIATDRVHSVERVKLEGRAKTITLDTDADWGGGFYVMANVVTPRDVVAQPVPRRALGVAYVPFDMSSRTLTMELKAPDVFRPRQALDLPVKFSGAKANEKIMLTLAAVDEGILRITKFKSPQPEEYYYGKRRLGVAIHDDYGRLLNANLGAATRFGGDQLGGEGLTVVPTKSVALFSGVVKVSGNGTVQVPIEVPDFNGELRLMAVAWSANRLGSADQAMTVRDPVPAEIALPRFLAPGDTASATLLIDNVEGAAGSYGVVLEGSGPIDLDQSRSFDLASGERQDAVFPLTTGEVGIADVSLSVSGPKDFIVSRSYPIQVRAPYFPVTEVETDMLAAGASFTLDTTLLAKYVPNSSDVKVSFSPLRGIDPQPLLDSLYRYPYGCTEQLTSSSWPLLYANKIGGLTGENTDRALRPRVQQAVNKILARQSPDGAFGLWRAGDRYADAWIGVFVTDFLFHAKKDGYAVPDDALQKAYAALSEITSTDRYIGVSYITREQRGTIAADKVNYLRRRASSYGFYVLARAGRADLSDIRYFHDNYIEKIPSPLARTHIGAALAMLGDQARAANSFKLAAESVGFENGDDYYQSGLRDVAGMIAIASEIQNTKMVSQLTDRLDGMMKEANSLNTQEKTFVLLASAALLDNAGDVAIAVNGTSADGMGNLPNFPLTQSAIDAGVTFTNNGSGPIFRSVAVHGAPVNAPTATSSGYTLRKLIRSLNGKPVDLNALRQNDRVIISIEGAPQDFRNHPSVIVDMLPAGLEIETILRPGDAGSNGVYRWLGALNRPKVAEARDDRFIAAIDVRKQSKNSSAGTFRFAYVARAVTPGEFTMPAAVVEDMYRPGVYARTDVRRLKIEAAQ